MKKTSQHPIQTWLDPKTNIEYQVEPELMYLDTKEPRLIGYVYTSNGEKKFHKDSPEERGMKINSDSQDPA